MLGFSFRGIHSSEFKIGVRSDNRTLLPSKRKNTFVIPGADGEIDFNDPDDYTYEPRNISVVMFLYDNDHWTDLRKSARDVAYWLSGRGRLVFDDEPDMMYEAIIYDQIDMEQFNLLPVGGVEISFECQPIAESIHYRQSYNPIINSSDYEATLNVNGNRKTGCIITIINNGTTPVKDIILKRKAEVR